MKILIKNIKGEVFEIECGLEETVKCSKYLAKLVFRF